MKRFLIAFIMLISFVCVSNAQVYRYQAGTFAIARVYNGNYSWGNWERSSMIIDINLNTDLITVYSSKIQYYKVLTTAQSYTDDSGGRQSKYYIVDGDGDRGTVRLRIQADGTSQIYIDFNDVAWCYGSLRRIY